MSMNRREADLPADHPDSNFHRSFNVTTSSSSSSAPSNFLRDLQAAYKRQPLGMMAQLKPRRSVVRGETGKSSDPAVDSKMRAESPYLHLSKKVQDYILQTKNMPSSSPFNHEDASITPPSVSDKTNDEGNPISIEAERSQPSFGTSCTSNNTACSSVMERDNGPKKVQFALQKNTRFHEMESNGSNQLDVSAAAHQSFQNMDVDLCYKTNDDQNQINPFRNFLQRDFGHNMTQSSVVDSSCATTTLVNSQNAPMLNSTTNCSHPQQNSIQTGEYSHVQNQPLPSDHLGSLVPSASVGSNLEKKHEFSKDQQGKEEGYSGMTKDPPLPAEISTKGNTFAADITDIQSEAPISDDHFSNVKTEASKSEKKEKSSRKRNYDPDLFFKVNGKLYQRLGKIGSGGSSEVHKVISQDCTIYALKKIKLKGRDYATAYGFCQEIEYLNKLKGRDHIIQLIDYEVTDKALMKEVMSGSVSNKNGKVKEDGHIYMVLEYGEIDLAHMLSHKWKELDNSKSNSTIDENWLRFYWQQMLLAVKTIHEERIVHSDLKPANFLLVRGSLKLIDFGIAKAIMSDTTNIQRDSQVGTLSYMSPEAFMCNETDAQGNIIKCGRPSDIWSLGCILYQMVYGRTPFSDYKTFWAKFKVVTDPHHNIQYQPVSNPCLLDLMKKCLAWDRNQRWRIPQLLQHPFLVPPLEQEQDNTNNCKFIRLVSESCVNNPKALMICGRIEELIRDPLRDATTTTEESRCISGLLYEMSKLCVQLKEELEDEQR